MFLRKRLSGNNTQGVYEASLERQATGIHSHLSLSADMSSVKQLKLKP